MAHLDDAGSVTKPMTRHVISKDKMLPRGGDSTTTIGDSHSSMFRPKKPAFTFSRQKMGKIEEK